jgi:hypothetical protein
MRATHAALQCSRCEGEAWRAWHGESVRSGLLNGDGRAGDSTLLPAAVSGVAGSSAGAGCGAHCAHARLRTSHSQSPCGRVGKSAPLRADLSDVDCSARDSAPLHAAASACPAGPARSTSRAADVAQLRPTASVCDCGDADDSTALLPALALDFKGDSADKSERLGRTLSEYHGNDVDDSAQLGPTLSEYNGNDADASAALCATASDYTGAAGDTVLLHPPESVQSDLFSAASSAHGSLSPSAPQNGVTMVCKAADAQVRTNPARACAGALARSVGNLWPADSALRWRCLLQTCSRSVLLLIINFVRASQLR